MKLVERQAPEPSQTDASWFSRLFMSLKDRTGGWLKRNRVPGLVRDAMIEDGLTGHSLEIRVGRLFTRIRVDGRDFYFDRFTGRFDGTGSGCD